MSLVLGVNNHKHWEGTLHRTSLIEKSLIVYWNLLLLLMFESLDHKKFKGLPSFLFLLVNQRNQILFGHF